MEEPQRRVLVVDDEASIRRLAQARLELAGYAVATVSDGPSAVEAATAEPPDLILLDLHLPGLDGHRVCAALRAYDATRGIPIIMLTGSNEHADRMQALAVGVDDFVTKPIDASELLARVQSLLHLSELRSELARAQAEALLHEERTRLLDQERRARAEADAANERLRGLLDELAARERRLEELVGRLLVVQEEERRRVAYEVHDGLAQIAAAAHLHLEMFAGRYRTRSPQAKVDLAHAIELTRATVNEARRVIAGLRPTTLDDFGLVAALQREVDDRRGSGWEIAFDDHIGVDRLPSTVETTFFRIAQEALTNIAKHSGTQRARLCLTRTEQAARLEVQDWGRGFIMAEVATGAGPGERVGLAGMQERVALLGGTCSICSIPGVGTTVTAEVPFSGPAGGSSHDE